MRVVGEVEKNHLHGEIFIPINNIVTIYRDSPDQIRIRIFEYGVPSARQVLDNLKNKLEAEQYNLFSGLINHLPGIAEYDQSEIDKEDVVRLKAIFEL